MQNIPSDMQQDSIRPNSDNTWLWLCQIAVPSKDTQYYARNTENVTYDSQVHQAMPFDVGNQTKGGNGSIPTVTLKVSALNETLYQIVQDTQGAIGSEIKLIKVNSDFLDTQISALEADYENLATQADGEWIYFTLGVPNPMNQRFPLRDYSSSICPWANASLFKGVQCGYSGGDTICSGTLEDCRTKGNAVRWSGEIGLDESVMQI